jgi:hypothetical protein
MGGEMNKTTIIFLVGFLFIAGCGTGKVYREIMKDKPSYNSREFSVSPDILYQAVMRIIYSKNFIVEKENQKDGFILAKRYFQKGKRNVILALQAKILPYADNKSLLYLNAFQTTERLYVADRTRFFMFIIPLPGGGGKEATKVKEGEKIIEDKKFYGELFSAIENEIHILVEKGNELHKDGQ